MLKPMLPTLASERPVGNDWAYEVKYDGFRCILAWTKKEITLISRNARSLNDQFPEIISFCNKIKEDVAPYLPLYFDGELVSLENNFKADFMEIQKRGRLRKKDTIAETATKNPCYLLVFDLIELNGVSLTALPFSERKQKLYDLFLHLPFSANVSIKTDKLIQYIPTYETFEHLWKQVERYNGEGVIAKRKNSSWEKGKRTKSWLKLKNYKTFPCFITAYQKDNGYFHVAVYKGTEIVPIGLFKHGMTIEQTEALIQTLKANKRTETKTIIEVEPAICIEIQCLELYQGQLREPSFLAFRFNLIPEDCTWETMIESLLPPKVKVDITSPDKILWDSINWTKKNYIDYIQKVSSYLLPFLKDRALTVIRYPHGVEKEAFYQKNIPEYAPDFIETAVFDDINYIVCNKEETLLWLANQIAIELHIPFQKITSPYPSEIVFDFDPPSRKEFHLAIDAVLMTKEVLDGLGLSSFVKTSGNKGLQMYIPLPDNKFSYEDTRTFTSFIADYLTTKEPDLFTTERMKKKRGNRLYVDYIQHAEGKTIIAPYSARGNKDALIATPLFWNEVTSTLRPEQFPISKIIPRLKEKGCPFAQFFETKQSQPFEPVLEFLTYKKP